MHRYVTLLFVIATVIVNGLANGLPINGKTTGEISNQFEVFFTPAGYVFSIWGLIYLSLAGFAVYQLLPRQRQDRRIDRVTVPFWTSSVANMAWILLWHYEYFVATLFVMLLLLASLLRIWSILQADGAARDAAERWLLRMPFSLYAGWVSIATLANLTVVLEARDLRPFDIGAAEWAIGMVVVGGAAALAVGHLKRDLVWLAVVVWAFVGIAVKQDWSGAVAGTAVVAAGLVSTQALWIAWRANKARHPSKPSTARDVKRSTDSQG
ncbi:MAG: tryptophan-rich sensory protein [Woeseiaceae bacterium]|nr:tryptophan-rich sensory protein [Woeseiaceae bacterium]